MILSESAHCAIVVVIELIRCYQREGISCKDISFSQHIPLSCIEKVVNSLESVGIVSSKNLHCGNTFFYLNRNPEELMLEDVVKVFDKEPFWGVFIDDTTGEILPQSYLSKLINKERQYINKYLKKRYRTINMIKLTEYTNKERRYL